MATAKKTSGRGTKKTSGKKTSTVQKKTGAAATRKQTTAKKTTAGGTRTTAGKASTNAKREEKRSYDPERDRMIRNEILILAALAVNLFLFISNLKLGGSAGNLFYRLMRGSLGLLGYAFPIYLFVLALFLVSNRDDFRAVVKGFVSFCVLLLLCGLIQMVTMTDFNVQTTAAAYYEESLATLNGGMVGGVLVGALYPLLGAFGTYLVIMVLTAAGIVFTTEKSILRPIRRGSREIYDRAIDDRERRREERENQRMAWEEAQSQRREEEKRLRSEQRVKGVTMPTLATESAVEPLVGEVRGIDNGYRSVNRKTEALKKEREREETAPLEVEETQVTEGRDTGRIPVSGLSRTTEASGKELAQKPEEEVLDREEDEANRGAAQVSIEKMPSPERTIRMIPIQKNGVASLSRAEEVPEGEALYKEAIVAETDYRTNRELEKLDALHSAFRKGRPEELSLKEWSQRREEELLETGSDTFSYSDAGEVWEKEEMPLVWGPLRESAAEPRQEEQESYSEQAKVAAVAEEPERVRTVSEELPGGSNEAEAPVSSVRMTIETARKAVMVTGPEKEEAGEPEEGAPEKDRENKARGQAWMDELEQLEQELTEEEARFQGVTGVDLEAGTRTVATAGGRVIEAEIDPADDPILRKRLQKQESIWAEEGGRERSSSGARSFRAEEKSPSPAGGQRRPEGSSQEAATPSQSVKKTSLLPYEKPPLSLMKLPAPGSAATVSDEELQETAHKLEQTLRSFGVGVTMTNISCGPAVTRYELQPDQGVKVSKIVSLSDDIKLNLAAADIRIEAPIPGKAAIGIEVPNRENQTVFLREVIQCEEFKKHKSPMAFALGRDIGGQCVVTDLAKMPHLLIAGATGSGKSVCINTLICSILYKAKPSEVKLLMIDPKVVELSVYNGIPNLIMPVVTDPKKASAALNWAVAEMTTRYKKFADWNVRDLKGYNEKVRAAAERGETEEKPLIQIVIIVDELADLMMVAPGEVEDAICRLAQMARAAGLHLVLATQRPSVNVITGLIKANVPSRIAFSVSSGVDSRTIIDMNGAEKLLGKGDMLFFPSGYQKPVRVQGAFLSDEEVTRIVEFLSERGSDEDEIAEGGETMEEQILRFGAGGEGEGGGLSSDRDSYFEQAGRFIIEKDKASIGMLQRAFKIGFNRAARIMDQLAEAGVVGEEDGTKPRRVLMTMEQFNEML